MGMINVLFRRSKIKNPAKITLKTVKKFIQGNYYKLLMKFPILRDRFVSQSRVEQIEWRKQMVKLKSPECYAKGECFCGCDLEGLISSDDACNEEGKCYPAIMDAITWSSYKIENNINIII